MLKSPPIANLPTVVCNAIEHPTMRKPSFLILLMFFLSCSSETGRKTKRIDVVGYGFDFPKDFNIVKGEHIDATVGQIKGDSFSIA